MIEIQEDCEEKEVCEWDAENDECVRDCPGDEVVCTVNMVDFFWLHFSIFVLIRLNINSKESIVSLAAASMLPVFALSF